MKPFLLDQLADVDMLKFALGRRCYRGEVLCVGRFACPGGTGHENDWEFSRVVGGHRARIVVFVREWWARAMLCQLLANQVNEAGQMLPRFTMKRVCEFVNP
jgi:hypothetical protein